MYVTAVWTGRFVQAELSGQSAGGYTDGSVRTTTVDSARHNNTGSWANKESFMQLYKNTINVCIRCRC